MSKPYYWWKGCDLAPFFAKVHELGLKNVRVEFHPEEGVLRVVDPRTVASAAATAEPGYDYSHVCPPDCPPPDCPPDC